MAILPSSASRQRVLAQRLQKQQEDCGFLWSHRNGFEYYAATQRKDVELRKDEFNALVMQHSKESPTLFIEQLGFNYHLEVIFAAQIIHLTQQKGHI